MMAEEELARSLLVALRPDFEERIATARQLAELILDAVAAALPLTRHEPAEAPLRELEGLAQSVDVYAWDGAPGWDEVLRRGLDGRRPQPPGAAIVDGLGAKPERTQQRGELKRRAHAEAERLLSVAREAARFAEAPSSASARVLDQEPTLSGPDALVAAHASLLRLVGLGCVSGPLLLPEAADAGPLPPPELAALEKDLDDRGEGFALAQEEWLARLLTANPAIASIPSFRTFYAGLSQSLRTTRALHAARGAARAGALELDAEAVLGALASWQPVRWTSLRAGAPTAWIAELCPAAAADEPSLVRLQRECDEALSLFSRLWSARDATATAFTAIGALFVARCASAVALWEELGGGAAGR